MYSCMGTSRRVALLATVVCALGAPRVVRADIKADVQAKIKEAMESYDLMDYDAAKKLLNQAVATAKRAKLDKDPALARAYLDLGIVAFAIPDQEAAKLSFISAVQIDPKIQIDAAYRSAEMTKLLDEARGAVKGGGGGAVATNPPGGGGSEDTGPAPDCGGVKGLQHEVIDTAKGGAPLKVEAMVGSDVKGAVKVSIMYRAKGATEFTEIKMTSAACRYSGSIPAAALKGDMLHYYVAAYDKSGRVIVGKGSQGSPNLVDVTGGGGRGAAKATDDEDPLGKGGGKKDAPKATKTAAIEPGGGGDPGEVDKPTNPSGPKQQRFLLELSVGTGFQYASAGNFTEGNQSVKNAGFTNSLLVITPELAYAISPKLAVGIAARLGFPLGANVDGHATLAPSVLARVHIGVAPGLTVIGQIGYGVVRGTIQLDNAMAGMNTDVVAEGPILFGAGLAYKKPISGPMSFVAGISALAAVAAGCTKNSYGTCSYNGFGTSPAINGGFLADVGVGLQAGF